MFVIAVTNRFKVPKAGTMMLTMWKNLAAAEGGRDHDLETQEPSSDAFPFVKLPPEIRNMVYKELRSAGCLGWQSAIERLSKLQKHRTSRKKDRNPVRQSTPAILLVSRQIHMEAIQVLYSTVFELPFSTSVMEMKRFFCKGVFEQLQYVTLKIDIDKEESQIIESIFNSKDQELKDTWYEMVEGFSRLWPEQHSLQHLRVIVTTTPSRVSPLRHAIFREPVMRKIRAFSTLRRIEKVSIEQRERVGVLCNELPRVIRLLFNI